MLLETMNFRSLKDKGIKSILLGTPDKSRKYSSAAKVFKRSTSNEALKEKQVPSGKRKPRSSSAERWSGLDECRGRYQVTRGDASPILMEADSNQNRRRQAIPTRDAPQTPEGNSIADDFAPDFTSTVTRKKQRAKITDGTQLNKGSVSEKSSHRTQSNSEPVKELLSHSKLTDENNSDKLLSLIEQVIPLSESPKSRRPRSAKKRTSKKRKGKKDVCLTSSQCTAPTGHKSSDASAYLTSDSPCLGSDIKTDSFDVETCSKRSVSSKRNVSTKSPTRSDSQRSHSYPRGNESHDHISQQSCVDAEAQSCSSRNHTSKTTSKKRKSKRRLFVDVGHTNLSENDQSAVMAASSCDEDLNDFRPRRNKPRRCSSNVQSPLSPCSPINFFMGDSISREEDSPTDSSEQTNASQVSTPSRRLKLERQASAQSELNPISEEVQCGSGFSQGAKENQEQQNGFGSFLVRAHGEDTVTDELNALSLPDKDEDSLISNTSPSKTDELKARGSDHVSKKIKKKKSRKKQNSVAAGLEQAQEGVRLAYSLVKVSMGQSDGSNLTINDLGSLSRKENEPTQKKILRRCVSDDTQARKHTLHHQSSVSSLTSQVSINPFSRVTDAGLKGSYLITEAAVPGQSAHISPSARTGLLKGCPASETTLLLNNHKFLRPENVIEKDIRLLQDYDNPMMLAKATRAIQDHMRDVSERTKSNCCMGNKPETMTYKENNVNQQGSPGPPMDVPQPVENGYGVHLRHEKWQSPYGKPEKHHSPLTKTENHLLSPPVTAEKARSPRGRADKAQGSQSRTDSRGRSPGKNDSRGRSPGGRNASSRHHNNNETERYVIDTSSGTTYIRGKLLGKGGFAKCYEMTDIKSKKSYAGKIIAKNRLAKPHQKEKILREIELHRMLRHRHVVAFHDYFEDEDNVYIILEVCRRKSLVHVLKNRKTLTEPEVRFYLRQLVEGTRYIHEMKVIHRDLKLGNMLLNDQMLVKIADFGLATKVEFEGEKKLTVCGTPNYIAPEVLQKKGHSYQADMWAMGCIMYAMLVGRPPFETSTLKETYMRITANKYTIPPHLSPQASSLIRHLLHPDPAKRPSLDNILSDEFFSGYIPKKLSSSCCEVAPKFPSQPPDKPERPRSYAAPVSSTEAMNKLTSSLAQLKGSRKSASQIITRSKTPDAESRDALGETQTESPLKTGSTPSNIHHNVHSNAVPMATAPSTTPAPIECKAPASGSAVRLYQMLSSCLEHIRSVGQMPNSVVDSSARPLWVSKWVDYSNKYGFGFQLSDKSVGILFNDTTRMLLAPDAKTAQYNDLSNKVYTFGTESAPAEYQRKVSLLLYFAQYMDEHLIPGGDSTSNASSSAVTPSGIFMKKWFRTSRAIVMYLNNGTLQVNFFEDHTKVILSPEPHDYLFTYVNSNRQSATYRLLQLLHFGAVEDVCERLAYSRRMLENIINIEGEAV